LSLLLTVAVASGCDGRFPQRKGELASKSHHRLETSGVQSAVVELDLTTDVAESTATGAWFPLPARRTYTGLVRAVERTRADRNTKAIYLRLGGNRLGWAKVEELGALLGQVKQKTPVYCHAHSLSNTGLWLTLKGCSKTWLSPAGDVEAIGLSTQIVYFKTLLDKLGVKADFLAVGKYKSAAESFLRDEPSDAARAEWLETLGSIRSSWLEAIAATRPDVVASLETGPWGAREAVERKLVDALGDEQEARRDALSRARATETKVAFGSDKKPGPGVAVSEILHLLSGVDEGASNKPHIAVVPLSGSITMGSDGLFAADGIAERAVSRTIERLIDDDAVQAVVLRIDSPGGSALASDLIWSRLRELGRVKPVIASVGGMAASGGYYLACAAQRIVAESTSIVGSIGVVGGKLVFGPALEPYGVHTVTLAPGSEASRVSYESPLVPWDDATRARVFAQMRQVYDLFVDRVTEGRKLKRERVLEIAEGRVFSGKQGLTNGLVDELGGLVEALAWARQQAGLDAQAPVTVEGQGDGFLAALGLDAEASSAQLVESLERQRRRLWSPLAMVPEAWVPWVAGVSPLLEHETVLALSPMMTTQP
jgi:protease-4